MYSHWAAAHLKWLKALPPEALYKEIPDEYLLTYQTLSDKLERLDKHIDMKHSLYCVSELSYMFFVS